jgi:hypothetical protein
MVPERGLEPPLPCENQVLNLARLPVPPFGHKCGISEQFIVPATFCFVNAGATGSSKLLQKAPNVADPGVPPLVFLIATSGILHWEWYTPPQNTVLPLACRPRTGTAVRFQREVTMETTQSGIIFYLLVVWGVVFAVFLALLLRKSLLEGREDDQLFINAAEELMAREQRELISKIRALSRPIMTSGITAGVLLLVIAGLWLYEGLKNF